MINNLNLIKQFLFDILDQVVFLYFSGGIFSAVFAVYLVRKVSRLFDYIVH